MKDRYEKYKAKFLKKPSKQKATQQKELMDKYPDNKKAHVYDLKKAIKSALGYPLFVALAFFASLTLIGFCVSNLKFFVNMRDSLIACVVTASVYLLTLIVVLLLPKLSVKKIKFLKPLITTSKELGVDKDLRWRDIPLAIATFFAYMLIFLAIVALVLPWLLPDVDMAQKQELGFEFLTTRAEYIAAFFALVIVAPVAEEVLFRGYLYGKLKKSMPIWIAILIQALLFGAVHMQWNVAIDTFVLAIFLALLREVSGSVWAGVLVHMIKNGIAFYLLFINPMLMLMGGGS